MNGKRIFLLLLVTVFAAALLAPQSARAVAVDLELAILVDVSGSISAGEFDLQQQGYEDAFNNSSVVDAIQAGALGQIAATLVYWSSYNQQQQAVGWTLIHDAATASAFATAIGAATRPYTGNTSISGALDFATNDISVGSNGFEGTRLVIDISGDGSNNSTDPSGPTLAEARTAALGVYDTINGLVIGGDSGVLTHYQTQVIGGTDAFAIQVDSFDDFGDAIDDKLIREIQPVPEPAAILLLGSGLIGLAMLGRKRFTRK